MISSSYHCIFSTTSPSLSVPEVCSGEVMQTLAEKARGPPASMRGVISRG
nr:hypothetical protein [uncultured bacterium]